MEIHTLSILYHIIFLTLFHREFSMATDTLTPSQLITDNTSLVSAQGKFQLGFFSPGNSTNRFLGIWFNNIPNKTVIWVANRESPLNDSTGVLQIDNDGNLILRHQNERIVWSSNIKNIQVTTVAQILDSGNLVLRDERNEFFLWQSFDHPSDTMIAGMKLGWDWEIGLNRFLTSWKNEDDPSNGSFNYSFDLYGLPQIVMREGSIKKHRSGLWDGSQFSGSVLSSNLAFIPTVVTNSKEAYYEYNLYNESTITMVVMSYTGSLQRLVWDGNTLEWRQMHSLPRDRCDNYGECGSNAVCAITDLRVCSCLDGYIPNSSRDWDIFIRSGGCVRRKPLNCPNGEGFIEVVGVKMPDLVEFRIEPAFTLDECKVECLKNCTCTAYANLNASDESGCLLWFNDLVDLRKLQDVNTKFYLRVTASELPFGEPSSNSKNKRKVLMVVMITGLFAIMLFIASVIIWKKRLQLRVRSDIQATDEENLEFSIFSMVTIAEVTHNFSYSNKIGEGGFGSVYKGMLSSGIEIAVKRLSLTSSEQGVNEFKNEVMLIAKLQHRNLVRLLGFCIQGDERMLIYEYLPNGSLDSFIFDDARSNLLGWSGRYDVIIGIARGLLYLHRDSRLRIIHRDLKASNILLDSGMNPKISDFGTARAFGANQNLAKTKRVIGTYGYMSPEYAIDGIFSVKSDIFSFGVLVLEIVSGKRNRQFHHPDHDLNLLGHAWKLWNEGKAFELLDPRMVDSVSFAEVAKCVQVGLLCVQHRPEDRPTMSSVVLLLDSVSVILPQPKHPGFYIERTSDEDEEKRELDERILTTNVLTNTLSDGR